MTQMELFFRHGEKFTGQAFAMGKGFAVTLPSVCGRCGGAGGSDKWQHTGWTCFDCGGSGKGAPKTHKLFSAEKLEKLNAAAAKRGAKKAAEAQAAREAAEAEANSRRVAFMAEHGALLERAQAFAERNPFVKDVTEKARKNAAMTEGQKAALEAAIARIEATDAKKAASGWVGQIGERLELTVVAERVTSIQTQFGTMRIAAMRTLDGNAIVTKGAFVPPTANWNNELERWEIEAEPFKIRGTVKGHDEFRGEKNTVLARAKEVEKNS
jgi:hypothetical protein